MAKTANTKPPSPGEVTLAEAQTLLQLWLKTKAFLAKGLTEDPISREEEQAFLDMKSDVTKHIRGLGQKLPPDITFGADKMQELMRQSISIGHLRSLPKTDKQTLMSSWHGVFIYMSRAVGALQFMNEGFTHIVKGKTGGSNLSDLKKAAGGEEKKSGGMAKKIIVAIVILVVVFIAYQVLSE